MPKPGHRKQPDAAALGGARIVYEDAEVLVVDKPTGMISARPGDVAGTSLFYRVSQYLRHGAPNTPNTRNTRNIRDTRSRGKSRSTRGAWVIHRLDREVSGLLVFAKSPAAFEILKDQLQRRQVQRRYLAVVAGELPLDPGRWQWIEAFLADDGPGRPVRSVATPPIGGKRDGAGLRAVTYYRVLAVGRGRSLLEIRLETGRKHQIRAHLAGAGHPVLGDRLYGGPSGPRLLLHAWSLAFAHPATGRPLSLLSPPESSFLQAVGAAADVLEQGPAAEPDDAPPAGIAAAPPAPPASPASPPTVSPAVPPAPPARRGAPAAGSSVACAGPADAAAGDSAASTGGQHVVGRHGEDHEHIGLPGVMRLLGPAADQRVLDVACGEGVLCRRLARLGVACVGVDASEQLIASARRRVARTPAARRPQFHCADPRDLASAPELADRSAAFDAAACVLALMNIDPIEPVLRDVAALLRPGGRFVAVVLHPAFRGAGRTAWQRETLEEPAADSAAPRARKAAGRGRPGPAGKVDRRASRRKTREPEPAIRQYRRVDAYLSPAHRAIVTNPDEVARGLSPLAAVDWHRPIQVYVKALAAAGLLIDALEEWASARAGSPGAPGNPDPHAAELDRARREIPMFMAIRARKV